MNPNKNKKKEPYLNSFLRILTAVSFIFLSASAAALYLLPQKADEIKRLSSELLAQKISKQNYQKTMVDLENIQEEKELMEKSFPNAESIVDFIELINQIEQKSQLKIFTFDSDLPLKDSSGNAFLPITIVVEDTWPNILESLNLLERSPYFYRAEKFTVSGPDIQEKEVRAEFNLVVYVDPQFEEVNEKN